MSQKILPVIMLLFVCLASCTKEVQPLSKEQMNVKIDSIIKASKSESDARAQLDLERRIKIEVKVKVDSILRAHQRPAAPAPKTSPAN